MSKPLQACLAHLGVLTLGLAAWHFAGKSLQSDGLFEAEPNVLSLKGSPFGKTIAMAMQGPIDVYWHEGEAHDHVHAPGESCTECDGGHGEEGTAQKAGLEDLEGAAVAITTGGEGHEACAHEGCDHADHEAVAEAGHSHTPGGSCEGCALEEVDARVASLTTRSSIRSQMLKQIQDWRAEENTRRNPYANTAAHKYFIRREMERKLMLTYRMDPTNYASYGAYFLYLSESSLSDREASIKQALRLSQATVKFCLAEQESATALLTGAAAAHDAVQLLINTGDAEARRYAEQYVRVAEQCLEGFEQQALQMAFDGTWEKFSKLRQQEMTERARLVRKLVESDRKLPPENANNKDERGAVSAG
ncbi:MAG: hypothetical protein O3A87_03390 [Verrucomicrobia bacterium]|nr:hypothetical protein [Verrucomicrobiota bacterium]MDA1005507.1 hypothetical protein [Verrucomicrobiota bacterium]